MAIEKLSIKAIDADRVHVGFQANSPCNKCSVNMGCGIGLMQLFRGKNSLADSVSLALPLPVSMQGKMHTGDPVRIAITDRELIKLSMLLYMLPLLCMLAVIGGMQSLAATLVITEGWIILAAILSLGAGFVLVRYLTGNIQTAPLEMIQIERDNNNAINK